MDDLIGVLIFAAFIVFSLLGRLAKKKPEDEESTTPTSPELDDLPETLRRMLTGQPPVRGAKPAEPTPQQSESVQPVPPYTRDAYHPPVARPAPAPPQRREAMPRPVAVPPPRPRPVEEEGPRVRPTQVRPVPQRSVTPPRPVPGPPALRPRKLQPSRQPTLTPTRIAPQPVARRAPEPAPTRAVQPKPAISHAFLTDLRDLRRGVILSEILAPPLALR